MSKVTSPYTCVVLNTSQLAVICMYCVYRAGGVTMQDSLIKYDSQIFNLHSLFKTMKQGKLQNIGYNSIHIHNN